MVVQIDREYMKMNRLEERSEKSSMEKLSNLLFDNNGILWLTSYDEGILGLVFPISSSIWLILLTWGIPTTRKFIR